MRRESLTLSPDPEHSVTWSFDLEGRPISWFEDDCLDKRSLASDVHGREQFHGARRRWRVPREEAARRFARMLERVSAAPREGFGDEVCERLAAVARWTPEALLAERSRFDAAYRPISILPPDQYLAVVLQATFGCSWNRCTFCDFYQGRPLEVRDEADFRAHAEAVARLLGRAENLRKRIFLADGNALILSIERLRPIFDVARRFFPGRPISGFVDVFSGEKKPAEGWEELRRLGLARAHVGIETGHDPLLAWMRKPGHAEQAVELVGTLEAAGLEVAVILLCGAGGRRFAAAHQADTVALLERLPLGAGDIVYLSPFVEKAASEYARIARAEGVEPLTAQEIDAQMSALREVVRRRHPAVRAALYDIREFVY